MKPANIAWLLAFGGLIGYEGWSLINSVPGDTLSEAVWGVIYKRPLIPFLAGIICGHFFWQRDSNGPKE